MVRTLHLLIALAALGGVVSRGYAQTSSGAPGGEAPAPGGPGPADVLGALPRPPDQPASLFAPPPPPLPPSPPLDRPYFVRDPELDPPALPPPGWFAGVETVIAKNHVKNQLANTVTLANGMVNTVGAPSAALDWTAAPRVWVGYRLPSGFGEFALAYRGLATQGSESLAGPGGVGSLTSRLDFNTIDLDYASREFSLWPRWDMKWVFGLRWASVYFDSRTDQPVSLTAGGLFETRVTDSFVGFGPHAGLELSRRIEGTGLALVARADFATLLGRIRQGYFESSTVPGPDGLPIAGESRASGSNDVPIVNGQLGVLWQPPADPDVRLFAGYQYEYWWHVGQLSVTETQAGFSNQGIVLQAAFRY
jgi:hypothetical protein